MEEEEGEGEEGNSSLQHLDAAALGCATFGSVEERRLASGARLSAWCPTMDLLAVVHRDGTVAVLRMDLHRLWACPPPDAAAGSNAALLTWRPDGRVLLVAYENGAAAMLEVERGALVHALALPQPAAAPCCADWIGF